MLKLFSRGNAADPLAEVQAELGQLELPTFPRVTMSALEKARDDDASVMELADVLATDPGLTVKILSTVNSAAFACRSKVRNIHHAVSLLGRNEIESMLISVAVRQALPGGDAPGFCSERFWGTSAKRAAAARGLAARIDPSRASESFTGALLQDMAVPLLAHQLGERYAVVLQTWHDGNDDLALLEQKAFGWDHAVLGAWMSAEWKFPEVLTGAIGSHHGTDGGEYQGLEAVTAVACLRETNVEQGDEQFMELARDRFDLAEEDLVALLEASEQDAKEVAALFAS